MTQPTLMAQLVELQEENARLREDAERYRWLRDLDVDDPRCEIGNYPGYLWDEAIDTFRKEQK